MRRIGSMFGSSLALGGLCLGDLGSDNSSSQATETTNNQIAQQAATGSQQFAVSGSSVGGDLSITSADPEVVKAGLELAKVVANYSQGNVTYALQALKEVQDRALQTVESATAGAQTVALTATPPSASTYAEISQSQLRSTLLITGAGVAVLWLISRK